LTYENSSALGITKKIVKFILQTAIRFYILDNKGDIMSKAVNFRMDDDLAASVDLWLQHNPGMKMSRLLNMAVRKFISEPQELKSVEVGYISDEKFKNIASKVMQDHSDMLDKLK
jgi:hypothetical protein